MSNSITRLLAHNLAILVVGCIIIALIQLTPLDIEIIIAWIVARYLWTDILKALDWGHAMILRRYRVFITCHKRTDRCQNRTDRFEYFPYTDRGVMHMAISQARRICSGPLNLRYQRKWKKSTLDDKTTVFKRDFVACSIIIATN